MSATKSVVAATVHTREYSDYDDNASDYTSDDGSVRKPLRDFGTPSTLVDDGCSPEPERAGRNIWGNPIAVRSRRKQSLDDVQEEVTEGLLAESQPRRKASMKRPWYIYCTFGGLGLLTLSCVS